MKRSVVQGHADVHDRISRNHSPIQSFFNSFLNGRNKFPRNGTANHLIFKFKANAPFHRVNPEPHVTILTSAAGLTNIFSFLFNLRPNSFAVSHLGFSHIGLHFELSLHSINQNFQMKLAHTGNNRLTGFAVGFDFKSWVFLCQMMKGNTHFFLISLGFGLNSHTNNRFREIN